MPLTHTEVRELTAALEADVQAVYAEFFGQNLTQQVRHALACRLTGVIQNYGPLNPRLTEVSPGEFSVDLFLSASQADHFVETGDAEGLKQVASFPQAPASASAHPSLPGEDE